MDELVNQLEQLGRATEAAIDPVTPADAVDRASAMPGTTDIGLARSSGHGVKAAGPRRSRRRLSPPVLLGAAAALIIVAGSIVFLGRSNDEQVDLASAMQAETFAVPDNDNGWQALRDCESKSTYDIDTGNSFYGAYQFTRETFRDTATALRLFAYADLKPSQTPDHIQDAVANALYLEKGAEPWPVCGRYIEGPMITPVVPQWLNYSLDTPQRVAVFINPGTNTERTAEIGLEIADVLAADEDLELRFVSQGESFAEFLQQFQWTDEEIGAIRVDDMPARYEIPRTLPSERLDELQAIPDVYEVLPARPSDARPAGKMKLSIPAIGLSTPIYEPPSTHSLATGAVLMVDSPQGLVVAGFGSEPGSVFAKLGELRDGDRVLVTTLIRDQEFSWELVRTYEIDRSDDDLPVYELADMLLWQAAESPGMTFVADIAGEPTQRLVVRARAANPERAGYPVLSEE